MGKQRAYGADATLRAVRETQYGGATTGPVRALDFKTADLSASIPLGDDPLLGRGRNAQDPYRGLVTDEGQLEIPFDLQGTGWWMTALFGDPQTTPQAATGTHHLRGQSRAGRHAHAERGDLDPCCGTCGRRRDRDRRDAGRYAHRTGLGPQRRQRSRHLRGELHGGGRHGAGDHP